MDPRDDEEAQVNQELHRQDPRAGKAAEKASKLDSTERQHLVTTYHIERMAGYQIRLVIKNHGMKSCTMSGLCS